MKQMARKAKGSSGAADNLFARLSALARAEEPPEPSPRPIANCRETFLGSSAVVQQGSEGAPVLMSNATEVETRLDASQSTSSVEPQ